MEKIKAVLHLVKRFQGVFGLLGRIRTLTESGQLDLAVAEFRRARELIEPTAIQASRMHARHAARDWLAGHRRPRPSGSCLLPALVCPQTWHGLLRDAEWFLCGVWRELSQSLDRPLATQLMPQDVERSLRLLLLLQKEVFAGRAGVSCPTDPGTHGRGAL